MLIRVAKLVNKKVVGVEALKHWQQLKIYEMLLARYFEKRKIKVLYQKIEFSIEI